MSLSLLLHRLGPQKPERDPINRGFDAPKWSVAASFRFPSQRLRRFRWRYRFLETIGEPDMPPSTGCAGFQTQRDDRILFHRLDLAIKRFLFQIRREAAAFSVPASIRNGVRIPEAHGNRRLHWNRSAYRELQRRPRRRWDSYEQTFASNSRAERAGRACPVNCSSE